MYDLQDGKRKLGLNLELTGAITCEELKEKNPEIQYEWAGLEQYTKSQCKHFTDLIISSPNGDCLIDFASFYRLVPFPSDSFCF